MGIRSRRYNQFAVVFMLSLNVRAKFKFRNFTTARYCKRGGIIRFFIMIPRLTIASAMGRLYRFRRRWNRLRDRYIRLGVVSPSRDIPRIPTCSQCATVRLFLLRYPRDASFGASFFANEGANYDANVGASYVADAGGNGRGL